MKVYKNPNINEASHILRRPSIEKENLEELLQSVFASISNEGDQAIKKFTKKFDGVEINQLLCTSKEMEKAIGKVEEVDKQAIQIAYDNIKRFHESQQQPVQKIEASKGVECWLESRPIEKVGLYIPGGSAPLFSSILMLGIPARIAGCKEISIASPPDKSGNIHPLMLYCSNLCGINRIYKMGGAQAIAAFSTGTETVTKVQKIFGPGNQYVTAAKIFARKQGVAIDFPAGPSELMLVADDSAKANFVAADLLSQLEHGEDSQVVLLSDRAEIIEDCIKEIEKQIISLPRKEIAKQALKHSVAICTDKKYLAAWINEYAPEHLILACEDAESLCKDVINAGSVFLGNYSPESAGDYASGTNHTLPTNGFAAMYSGVNLDSFQKRISFQRISKEGLKSIGPAVMRMAQQENLEGHSRAVKVRISNI